MNIYWKLALQIDAQDKILILGNGGVKNSRTYNEDDTLSGYVITLQNFERLLKEGQQKGVVSITEKTIEIKEADSDDSGSTDNQCNNSKTSEQ